MKANLLQSHPVIVGEYITDGNNDPDYDHIVPIVGVTSPTSTDPSFNVYNLYSLSRLSMKLSQYGATRKSCSRDLLAGGCIPMTTDYGTAVTGIMDADHATLPVTLSVDRTTEPNYSPVDPNDPDEYRTAPQKPVMLNGVVKVSQLVPGQTYRLLRYDNVANVPTSGSASAFLTSKYTSYVDFTATGTTWSHSDTFMSNGTIFYRCVKR